MSKLFTANEVLLRDGDSKKKRKEEVQHITEQRSSTNLVVHYAPSFLTDSTIPAGIICWDLGSAGIDRLSFGALVAV